MNTLLVNFRLDEMCLRRQEQTGFMPPDRPKRWKDKCFTVLEEWIANRYYSQCHKFSDTQNITCIFLVDLKIHPHSSGIVTKRSQLSLIHLLPIQRKNDSSF